MADIKRLNSLDEFNEFIKQENTTNIIKFYAEWCGPCKTLSNTIQELTEEDVEGVMLAEVNVEDEWFEDKATELKIRGIPVMIAFKGGEELERMNGLLPKTELVAFIKWNK